MRCYVCVSLYTWMVKRTATIIASLVGINTLHIQAGITTGGNPILTFYPYYSLLYCTAHNTIPWFIDFTYPSWLHFPITWLSQYFKSLPYYFSPIPIYTVQWPSLQQVCWNIYLRHSGDELCPSGCMRRGHSFIIQFNDPLTFDLVMLNCISLMPHIKIFRIEINLVVYE